MVLRTNEINPDFKDNVSTEKRGDITVIFIKKNLSYQTADDLKATYPKIDSSKILIDLGQVMLTTSRGMAALIGIVIDAAENGQQVCMCNVSKSCMNIIDAMDIMNHVSNLKIFETLDEGVAYFRRV